MYAESGLPSPYLANLSHQVQHFDESSFSLMPIASLASANLGGEPLAGVDPMTGAISMLACGDDVITPQSLTISDIESSIRSGHLLSEVFYECRKDLLAKEGNETALSDVFSIELPTDKSNDENITVDENILASAVGIFQKSISLTYSRSMDQFVHETTSITTTTQGPTFQDFPSLEFGAAYGMRRAFSEGDIKGICASEDRMEKLSRYWIKKSKRNFGKKLKYACRKTLADSQPRVRGRFAKTEEIECPKKG
ncbi:hypothetical protein ABFS82_06G101600 [Erythranthe guttata]|uniref:CCT domain-containing protein n=1 Tax=Erythranthe guttata TaxID=4155 RepID=A0A022PXS7_ERYGU|nr:PREDICTED: zinc finger protein HD1-like [Erythranthe guttata]EYU19638.1 hypothetical protein MIMGU_mgv1a021380mg [Erythranthe guttata]|eukprot:XP_012858199.1 PREDICTED: zinc finger protein HD1-like [Erythranthe guttata]